MASRQESWLQHITGLRGLAIIMVVLFHLFPRFFPNGFYGVDVFFVITGYLLFRGLKGENNHFLFYVFLKKKVIRIYPLLSVLIILAGVSSIPFMYDSADVVAFGKNALYTFCGYSNYHYIKVYSDYFATDSNFNPLLHTWYLSVTIQVYLLWALGSMLLLRAPSRLRLACVCLIGLASLLYYYSFSIQQMIISWWGTGWGQKEAVSYYDTLGRIWQIMAGGTVLFLPDFRNRFIRIVLLLTGLTILCYSAFCHHTLPVWNSFLVVIATVLLIRYGGVADCHKLMENTPLLLIGKISFSLYIIHFPLFVFFRRWERIETDILSGMMLLVVSFACAIILWKMVEIRKFSLLKGGVLALLSLVIALGARASSGLPQWDKRSITYPVYPLSEEHTHYPPSIYNGYDEKIMRGESGTQSLLRDTNLPKRVAILSLSGMEEKPQFVLVGNSVAQQYYAGFHEVCKERNIPGIHLTTIVYPLWNYHCWLNKGYCWTEEKAKAFSEWLRCHPEIHTVVVSFLWKSRQESALPSQYTAWDGKPMPYSLPVKMQLIKEFCLQMRAAGKHVVFITPSPVFMEFEDAAFLGKGEDYVQWRKIRNKAIVPHVGEDPFVITKDEYMSFNDDVFAMLNELEREGYCKLLHIEKSIFRDGNFAGLKNGTLFCRDKTHVTPAAAIYIIQGVADEFESIMRENQATPVKLPADAR